MTRVHRIHYRASHILPPILPWNLSVSIHYVLHWTRSARYFFFWEGNIIYIRKGNIICKATTTTAYVYYNHSPVNSIPSLCESCLQTTPASRLSHESSQTVPHTPSRHTSSLPRRSLEPPTNWMSPSSQVAKTKCRKDHKDHNSWKHVSYVYLHSVRKNTTVKSSRGEMISYSHRQEV